MNFKYETNSKKLLKIRMPSFLYDMDFFFIFRVLLVLLADVSLKSTLFHFKNKKTETQRSEKELISGSYF